MNPNIEYRDDEYLKAWSESTNIDEVKFLLDYCCKQDWIEQRSESCYWLTVEGYKYLDKIEGVPINSSQVFVAMWFDESMEEAWKNGFKVGIEDAGYEPIRIDKSKFNDKIDDKIIAEIRRSRFVVADFTQGDDGARGGVYYEAGFAHGLNIPVIFTCRAEKMKHVHFDTRQFNHIVWSSPTDLRSQLADRISATEGDGPNKDRV